MTYTFTEPLHVDGAVYRFDSYPLQRHVAKHPSWPRYSKRPWNTNGYFATWELRDGVLYLTKLDAPGDDPLALLFPGYRGPVPAFWIDDVLHAVRGDRHYTGYPPRQVYHDELYLEIRAGKVTRQWHLDLSTVPGQTDEELRLSLPRFLWPARLREDPGSAP